MGRLSIKTKIVLFATLVLGIVLSGFSVVIYQNARSAYFGRLDARLEGQAEKIREEVEEQYLEKRFPNVPDLLRLRIEGLPNPHLRLMDSAGTAILDDSLFFRWPAKAWNLVKAQEFSFEERVVEKDRYRSLWAPVEANDLNRYAIQIAVSVKEVEASLALLQLLFVIGVPLALLISAAALFVTVTTAFRPLSAMIGAAEKVSASNLGERLSVPESKDEVFALVTTFNAMMERLEAAFKSQKQFVADASHEIRTPLTIIRSELEYAQKHPSEPTLQGSLEAALSEVDRLKRLSDDLLMLARLESPSTNLNIQPLRIDEVLTHCVVRMKPVADQAKVTLELEICEAIEIGGDTEKLTSGIVNLIDNAIKYSREGGKVTIRLSRCKGAVEISFQDEGKGIPVEEQQNIFKRFHRSESARTVRTGSGLGLAIVHRIVELHNFTISVVSRPEKGSVFTISIPTQNKDPDI